MTYTSRIIAVPILDRCVFNKCVNMCFCKVVVDKGEETSL